MALLARLGHEQLTAPRMGELLCKRRISRMLTAGTASASCAKGD
jgi:hypothetical protein